MSYEHEMTLSASIREDVTDEQVQNALLPIFDALDYPADTLLNKCVKRKADHQIWLKEGKLFVYTNMFAPDGFLEVIEGVAKTFTGLVSHAGEIELLDCETGDRENAMSKIFFGPSDWAIKEHRFNRFLEESLQKAAEFMGNENVALLKQTMEAMLDRSDQLKNEVLVDQEVKEQREYHVTWEIDVIADCAVQAAKAAMKGMPHPTSNSDATVFLVEDERGVDITVDLGRDEHHQVVSIKNKICEE